MSRANRQFKRGRKPILTAAQKRMLVRMVRQEFRAELRRWGKGERLTIFIQRGINRLRQSVGHHQQRGQQCVWVPIDHKFHLIGNTALNDHGKKRAVDWSVIPKAFQIFRRNRRDWRCIKW